MGMKKVSQTYHLIRRNGTYQYRRRVPLELVAVIGKKEIQFSLGTSNLTEAKKRRAVEDLKWSTRFEVAANGLVTRSSLYRSMVRLRELGLDPGPDDLSAARRLGRPTRGIRVRHASGHNSPADDAKQL